MQESLPGQNKRPPVTDGCRCSIEVRAKGMDSGVLPTFFKAPGWLQGGGHSLGVEMLILHGSALAVRWGVSMVLNRRFLL